MDLATLIFVMLFLLRFVMG